MHIRGLDDLTTDDIKAFSMEHFPQTPPLRVEWVDDTSANLVFGDPATASCAIRSFTLPSFDYDTISPPDLHLREAKRSSVRPDTVLQVRIAFSTDQKRPRAHEASRFYMLHPEYDPRERGREGERKRYHGNGEYRSKRYGYEEQRRRKRINCEEGFDPSIYDDKSKSSERGSMRSPSEDPPDNASIHLRRRAHSHRPARDRSASPGKYRIGSTSQRRRSPPPPYSYRNPHPHPSENLGKELFPSKCSSGKDIPGRQNELLSNKVLAEDLKMELFPQKVKTVNHRRSDAIDAADETADLFANSLSVSLTEGPKANRDLAGRITKRSNPNGQGKGPDQVLEGSRHSDSKGSGVSILGASNRQNVGFSIRGGAAAAAGTIQELFPGKASGNQGKELFAEKIPRRRNRAADMFH